MMFKQISVGEVKIGERTYSLLCDPQSPLGELHDALMQMKGHVVERMIEAHRVEKEQVEKQNEIESK
jgi:hypothetical protein